MSFNGGRKKFGNYLKLLGSIGSDSSASAGVRLDHAEGLPLSQLCCQCRFVIFKFLFFVILIW